MKKIKVNFHITTLFFGGIEKTLLTYLNNIDRNRFIITLTIARYMGSQLETLVPELPHDVKINYIIKSRLLNNLRIKKKLGITYTKFEKFMDSVFFRPLSNLLHRLEFYFRSKDYDVVVDFDLYPYKLKSRAPLISFLHFNLSSQLSNQKDERRITSRFKMSSYVVVLNKDMQEECISNYSDIAGKFYIIYNPFDIEKIKSYAIENCTLNIDKYIITVCRLEESQKDVESLIRAFKILKDKLSYKGKLVIIGDGSSKTYLEKLSSDLFLDNSIIFLGIQNNPFKYMKNAEVFILSSKFEGFGNVIVEAMACEVPIVAADCPVGPREILQNGECGILFPVGNHEYLAQMIDNLLTDYTLSDKLKSNMKSRVNTFAINNSLQEFYHVIEKALYNKRVIIDGH
ncbi:MAG: glycosyltransferase [Burkholderiales bacterium]|nr:glycosyltransferase [Burkholderiales bacterium]